MLDNDKNEADCVITPGFIYYCSENKYTFPFIVTVDSWNSNPNMFMVECANFEKWKVEYGMYVGGMSERKRVELREES